MRWFKSKKEIEAEAEETFRTNLAKKLEGYESNGLISNFSVTNDRPDDTHLDHTQWLNQLHDCDGFDPDPRWLDKPDAYTVEEVALTDLTEADIEMIARLRETYLDNLRIREIQADPDTQRFSALIRGEDVKFPNK